MARPCMSLINPDIRMLRSLTSTTGTVHSFGRTKFMIVP